jgi:hypothetical protein
VRSVNLFGAGLSGNSMAIYTTVFLARPLELSAGFPGWKSPLAEPVTRTFMNPFFKTEVTVTTREPEWPESEAFVPPEYGVVAIQGDYGDYLESRIPAFVRSQHHWCGKGLTSVELDPLIAAAMDSEDAKLEPALFAHPSWSSALDEFPGAFVARLQEANEFAVRQLAQKWAKAMSDPQHTHSVNGDRLEPDWTMDEALRPLQSLVRLAKMRSDDERMYLLTEA